MTWSYRIVRSAEGLCIYDVYYDEANKPTCRHAQPTYVYGETVEELRQQLLLMLEALEAPILEDTKIG